MKTAELPPDRNYVLGAHPHGVMVFGTFINFFTNVDNFRKEFPGIHTSVAVQAIFFHLPVSHDYFMSYGEPRTEWEEAPVPSPHLTASHTPNTGTWPEHWPASQWASNSLGASVLHPCWERHYRSH